MSLSRRELIVDGLRVTAVLPLLVHLRRPGAAAGRSRERGERVLVVLQLTGGNDGLNTLVPHRQDDYYRSRPTLALERSHLHALDDDHGLHPALPELAALHHAGALATIHGVGYPDPDRSHFRSMEVWNTAILPAESSSRSRGVGWMGRLADQIAARDEGALPAIHVGEGDLPLAMRGERVFAPSVADAKAFRLHPASEEIARGRKRLLGLTGGGEDLAFLRRAARTSYDAAARIQALAAVDSPIPWPQTALARSLRLVARLVTGGFGARLFYVELGGFDTHVRQRNTHAELLGVLDGALGAFQRDLSHHGVAGDVTTLAFSEFGRRVAENGSAGTDHGAGAPAFLVGEAVAPGLHGSPPDLRHQADGDVPYTTDFRRVYTALERDWMGLEPSTDLPSLGLFG